MAVRATKVFMEHAKDLEDMDDGSPFEMPNFHFVETVDQSKAVNMIKAGAIILSASGMCEAGRIRHHLKHNLWRPECTVLFVGYQAPGTLGQLLVSGAKTVRIHNEEVIVRAAMRRLEAYSGHADGPELVTWIKERLPVKSGIFLTHGEPDGRQAFKAALWQPAATAARSSCRNWTTGSISLPEAWSPRPRPAFRPSRCPPKIGTTSMPPSCWIFANIWRRSRAMPIGNACLRSCRAA